MCYFGIKVGRSLFFSTGEEEEVRVYMYFCNDACFGAARIVAGGDRIMLRNGDVSQSGERAVDILWST